MRQRRRYCAFTLVELLVVLGLIVVLMSLLVPAMGKARAAARSTACLSNVRQIGTAWVMYTAEHKGQLINYIWSTPKTADTAWYGYWTGVMDEYQVRGEALLCPAASEVSQQNKGYGNARLAWTGELLTSGANGIKLTATTFRVSSYGMNKYMTANADDTLTTKITGMRRLSDLPVFLDCAYADVRPADGSDGLPVEIPPDLNGNVVPGVSPEHWKFLLARHGRGINVFFADGSARWVPLDETYELKWNNNWQASHLDLPRR
jgi:prepilin-type processing-associated H-X9-DG protein